MCVGGGGGRRRQPPVSEYKNRPVTVTGTQTGVANPIDTAKATESLKIQRQKEEGTYVDPAKKSTSKLRRNRYLRSRGGQRARSLRSASLRSGVSRGPKAPSKAQKMAAARKAKNSRR